MAATGVGFRGKGWGGFKWGWRERGLGHRASTWATGWKGRGNHERAGTGALHFNRATETGGIALRGEKVQELG